MADDERLNAALDTLAQYRDEGIVLTSALEHLRSRPAALDRALARLDPAEPDALADGFTALRQDLAHTRELLDVAIDFLDKAIEELGHTPPYRDRAEQRLVAEEQL
jgi:hypothetical protein